MAEIRIYDFPDDLHEELKIESVKKKTPLYKLVIEIIRKYFETK